ncbi:hypothetical protein PIB30_039737 [Stylosanthes scabra]|uniref:Uncharacterized protein n=1 Tax=Stylosanthes scabra TaxID=79078 RepID=A0ABU6SF82_9FABA|nr:hypothetical protein [Stylosanthes scabra]
MREEAEEKRHEIYLEDVRTHHDASSSNRGTVHTSQTGPQTQAQSMLRNSAYSDFYGDLPRINEVLADLYTSTKRYPTWGTSSSVFICRPPRDRLGENLEGSYLLHSWKAPLKTVSPCRRGNRPTTTHDA